MTNKIENFSVYDEKYLCSFPQKSYICCENIAQKFHINFLPSFFFWQSVSEEVYYRLNNSYTHLQAAIGKVFAFIVQEKP